MNDRRRRDVSWQVCGEGQSPSFDGAQLAVLMDIREELKLLRYNLSSINMLFHCRNFTAIPAKLDSIRKNTAPKQMKKVRRKS
jgi:hypothetical protein